MKLLTTIILSLASIISLSQTPKINNSETFKRPGGSTLRYSNFFNLEGKIIASHEGDNKMLWVSYEDNLTIKNAQPIKLKRVTSSMLYYNASLDGQMVFFFNPKDKLYQYKTEENKKGSKVLYSQVTADLANLELKILSELPPLHKHVVYTFDDFLVLEKIKLKKKGMFEAMEVSRTYEIFNSDMKSIYDGKIDGMDEFVEIFEYKNVTYLTSAAKVNGVYEKSLIKLSKSGDQEIIKAPISSKLYIANGLILSYNIQENRLVQHEYNGATWSNTICPVNLEPRSIRTDNGREVILKPILVNSINYNDKIFCLVEFHGYVNYNTGTNGKIINYFDDALLIEMGQNTSELIYTFSKTQVFATTLNFTPSVYAFSSENKLDFIYYDNINNSKKQKVQCKSNHNQSNGLFKVSLDLQSKKIDQTLLYKCSSLKGNQFPAIDQALMIDDGLIVPNLFNNKYSLTRITY